MTILTKPSNERKSEKVPLPLALGGGHDDVSMLQGGVAHGTLLSQSHAYSPDAESMVFNRSQFSCVKTILVSMFAVFVMMMGVLVGYTMYRLYVPLHPNVHYRAFCDLPYTSTNISSLPHVYEHNDDFDFNWSNFYPHIGDDAMEDTVNDNFFREDIELETNGDESYAKIDVPDFKDGRRGRFMHDFKENQSAIIDTTANRCFIMPLDRNTTLPPKSFLDLMQKMGAGYYNIDTDRVRRKMRVVTPPIADLSQISERIANECYDMKVYKLENYVSGVFKREARPITEAGKFAGFSGKGIVEFDLININDIEDLESQHQK